jgi:hypothetical protein
VSAIAGMNDDTAKCVADHLAIVSDQLAEAVAFMSEERPPGYDSVLLAFGTLFKLRAELGFTGGMVVADLVEDEPARLPEGNAGSLGRDDG